MAKKNNNTQNFNTSSENLTHNLGYVGDIGTTPQFSQEMAVLRQTIENINNAFNTLTTNIQKQSDRVNDASKNVQKALAQRESARVNYGSKSKEYSREQRNVKKARNLEAQEQEKLNKLESQQIELAVRKKSIQAESNLLNKEISKEIAYQNKKLEEGVTFQEKTNHFLNNNVLNVQKFKNGMSEVSNGLQSLVNIVDKLTKPWKEVDQAASNYAKHIGLTKAQYSSMRKEMLKFSIDNHIGERFNKSAKEAIELQEKLASTTGRQTSSSNEDLNNVLASSQVMGDERTAAFQEKLENFGLNQTQAADRAAQLWNEANKYGLAFDKYSDNFLSNIKMAQNYTFKEGVKGFAEMAKRSTEIKLNMQNVTSFADKVSTVEGAMKAGANLSVLGGSMANFADPMRMLYLSLNDVGGLEKHIEGMFGNMAKWNKDTKQLDVSSFNRMRIKAAADATGMNYNDLMDSIFAQGRRKIIEPELDKQNLTKDQKEAILNKAQLDENGKGYVSINGKKKMISEGFNEQELDTIARTGDDSKNIQTIAEETMSLNEKFEGFTKNKEDLKAEFIERTKIGDTLKDKVMPQLFKIAGLIAVVETTLLAIQGLMSIGGMANGAFDMLGSFGGKGGKLAKLAKIKKAGRLGTLKRVSAARSMASATGKGATVAAEKGITKAASKSIAKGGGSVLAKAGGKAVGSGAAKLGGKMLMGGLKGLGPGLVAGIAGGALDYYGDTRIEDGNFDTGTYASKMGGNALSWGAMGATIGGMVGGPWGAAIGAGLGAAYGLYEGYQDTKKAENLDKLAHPEKYPDRRGKEPFPLKGDYDKSETDKMVENGKDHLGDDKLIEKIISQEGIPWSQVPKFRNGGIFKGIGTDTSDSNLALLSNNEYIMPSKATKNPYNRIILDKMRSGSKLVPKFKDGGMFTDENLAIGGAVLKSAMPLINPMLAGMINTLDVKPPKLGSNSSSSSSIKVELAPLNVTGTIKLDLGKNKKDIDANQLLNNSQFIKKLTDQITKKINTEIHMGYDKNTHYKKF